jgi:hypothetical protein
MVSDLEIYTYIVLGMSSLILTIILIFGFVVVKDGNFNLDSEVASHLEISFWR